MKTGKCEKTFYEQHNGDQKRFLEWYCGYLFISKYFSTIGQHVKGKTYFGRMPEWGFRPPKELHT